MWAGDPAAHSGYMRAGGSGGCMGAGSPAAYMKAGGSAAYSRHVGEEVQQLTVGICMGQEVQLFIVGTWGQGITVWVHGGRVWVHGGRGAVRGSSCLQWVHEGRGSNTCTWGRGCSYLQWVGGLGVQLTVGT